MPMRWFAPVTLREDELDAVMIALDELNVYNQTPEIKSAIDDLMPRLREAKERSTMRVFQDALVNAEPEDIVG